MPIPRLYLGTMTFGWSQTSSRVDEKVAMEMVQQFVRHNNNNNQVHHTEDGDNNNDQQIVHRIDTARIYAGGKTEPIVGAVVSKYQQSEQQAAQESGGEAATSITTTFEVGTKAHPSQPGGLSPEGIETQLQASLHAMGNLGSIGEYYLHQPDPDHSLRESLVYLNGLVEKGTIQSIGMSNYHASEMQRAFAICQEEDNKLTTKPTVYQGLYNPLNRLVERELLPLLKANNCSFVAYNPLAAGLLAGKHESLETVLKGRFKNNQNYLPRFYTSENFQAMDLIQQACNKEGIGLVEATYRWLLCHSALTENDGVLLGASSIKQLEQNLQACAVAAKKKKEESRLPQSILDAFDQAWEITQSTAFPYWRSYSADMPNRESLDQGASYKVAK